MGIAALLIPLLPGLIESVVRVVAAIRADPALTPEQRAAADAALSKLRADLAAEVGAVEGAPDVT